MDLKNVTSRSNVRHSVITVVELVGVHRPKSGDRQRVSTRQSAECLLHMLKNAESNAEQK